MRPISALMQVLIARGVALGAFPWPLEGLGVRPFTTGRMSSDQPAVDNLPRAEFKTAVMATLPVDEVPA